MSKIVIDIEFTGLDNTFIKDNEIIQLKMKNLGNGKSFCEIFSSEKPSDLGAFLKHDISSFEQEGKERFSKEIFSKALEQIGGELTDEFIGFSISQDKLMLNKYDINLGRYSDIKDSLMLSVYEKHMAIGGSSLECVYYMLFSEKLSVSHGGLEELAAIEKIYLKSESLEIKERLELVPFGHCSG